MAAAAANHPAHGLVLAHDRGRVLHRGQPEGFARAARGAVMLPLRLRGSVWHNRPPLHPMIWKESSRHRQSKLMFGAGRPLALQVNTVN